MSRLFFHIRIPWILTFPFTWVRILQSVLLLLLPVPRLPLLPHHHVATWLRLETSSLQWGTDSDKVKNCGPQSTSWGWCKAGQLQSLHWRVALLFPQPRDLGIHDFPKKYSCYLLKQILSLPHLIIQWWTLELSTGWKITCFSKYKISISAAFASPSSSHPWPQQPPAIQTLTVIMRWSEKERQEGGNFISSLWDVYCFFCSQRSQGLCRFTWCFIMGIGSHRHRWVHLHRHTEPGDLNLYLPDAAVIGTPRRGNPDKVTQINPARPLSRPGAAVIPGGFPWSSCP